MSNTYKVPQDVEAEDKLLGPFSFRQFIYLIIVALAGALAWGLAQIFIGLAIIPLPVILLFGILALPLRKDQPMEIYLAAILSFYLKPHLRLWDPEGVETTIEVTAPKTVETSRTKDLSDSEAEQRLNYLANIVDSGGWAIRGGGVAPNSAMISDVFYDAQNIPDVLDSNDTVGQSFEYLIGQTAEKSRQETLDRMRQALAQPTSTPSASTAAPAQVTTPPVQTPAAVITPTPTPAQTQPAQPVQFPSTRPSQDLELTPHPYEDNLHMKVINPLSEPSPVATKNTNPQTPPSTSEKPLSPDIINLATNPDLSVETIAKQAERLTKKSSSDDEYVLSLR